MFKKVVGYTLLLAGLLLFVIVLYLYFSQRDIIVSPVPNDRGIKVIYK